jgi:hypothetical protein
MECGSRSYRLRMFTRRTNMQKRQLRLPHSMAFYIDSFSFSSASHFDDKRSIIAFRS